MKKELKDVVKGDIFVLPKNTFVWSVDLQRKICFEDDLIVEVMVRYALDKKHMFVKGKDKLFDMPGQVPGMMDNQIKDISVDYDQLVEWPGYEWPNFLEARYEIRDKKIR